MEQTEPERWEYETVKPPRGATHKEATDPEAVLNERAADGWRFVDTVDYTGGGTKFLVFERPAAAGDDAA